MSGIVGESEEFYFLERPSNRFLLRTPATPVTFSNNSSHSNIVFVSTTTPELLELNSVTGQIVRKSPATSVIDHLQYAHSCLLAGCADGMLRILDDRRGSRREGGESSVRAHLSSIQDVQYSGNFVYTIGWGVRLVYSIIHLLQLNLFVQARSSISRSSG